MPQSIMPNPQNIQDLPTHKYPVSPASRQVRIRPVTLVKQISQHLESLAPGHREARQQQPNPATTAADEPSKARRRRWRRRLRPLTQMNNVECGFACLAMILNYYGRPTSVSELRSKHGIGRDGLSALSIVKTARSYGLRVRAVSLQQPQDLRSLALPVIVHWEFNHFLVVERWTRKGVYVIDPAWGRKRLTHEEFDAGFTGIVITLEPGIHFDRERAKGVSQGSLRSLARQYIHENPGFITQIVGASLLLQIFGLILPLLTKVVVDQVLPGRMASVMTVLGLGILILLAAQAITTLLREWVLVYLRARLDIQLVLGFFEHLLTLPYNFFQQRSSGDLLQRLGSNSVIRDTLSNQLISTLLDSGSVVAYLFILFWLSPPFALLTIVLGILQVIVLVSTNQPVCELASRDLAAQGRSQGYLAETLAGMATLKAAGAEQRALERWSNLFYDQLNITVRRSYLQAWINTSMSALRALSPLALLWIGALLVLNGTLSIGTMLALNALSTAFLAPLASLVSSGQQFQIVYAHMERLTDVTTAEPEQLDENVLIPPRLSGRVVMQQVSFRYAADAPQVLKGVNLHIAPGQRIAIVGRTGSGKSTLGKLLLGIYVPSVGDIYYDDLPLRKLNFQEVRRQFGVVLQDSHIFSGSILQNIVLNDPNIDKERVVQAARAAAIHDDIMRMPMAYDTLVAEGGSALSGGQRQRLALARALVNHPAILLLDEATSHLDVVTEQQVAQNLRAFPCTQVIIAHRLSTIRDADLILVLDDGSIVEGGTHQQLLQKRGYYATLMQQQLEQDEKGIA